MNKKNSAPSSTMVATKSKHKVTSCSTPEHQAESPSRDSDSFYDSEATSPVPFLCTQDGAEGETDVVWNFYTPKSDNAPASRFQNSTPLSTKTKKAFKHKIVEKPLPKRRTVKPSQKNTAIFQDLIELNQNLHEIISKKSNHVIDKPQSGSEEDIFNDSGESSPKSGLRTNSRCLRRNVLSSKFTKPDTEAALESDDSMNECLIKASQVVEEKILKHEPTPAKRSCFDPTRSKKNYKSGLSINMDNDSMDAILNNINLESPLIRKMKKCDSPKLNNDSFDSIVGNLNDSALERLTQMPTKTMNNTGCSKLNTSNTDWTIKELVVHDPSFTDGGLPSPPNKSFFGRHNSMPESPLVPDNKPSTSGMVFGRYNSMPHDKNGDSPIRCTPDEIKRKHQQAREKLLAKRLLPFTSSQQPSQTSQPTTQVHKKTSFHPRVASSTVNKLQNPPKPTEKPSNSSIDIKQIIEKKRQEALMKLRRRQPQY